MLSAHPKLRIIPTPSFSIPFEDSWLWANGFTSPKDVIRDIFTMELDGGYSTFVDTINRTVYDDGYGYYVEGFIYDQWEREIGSFERIISDANGVLIATHENMEVGKVDQNMGIGRDFFVRTLAAYKKYGVDHIRVYAGNQVGGYMWARMGFRLAYEDERMRKISYFLDHTERAIDLALRDDLIGKGHARDARHELSHLIRQNVQGSDIQPIDVSKVGEGNCQWKFEGHTYWPGKKAMLGKSWDGAFYLQGD